MKKLAVRNRSNCLGRCLTDCASRVAYGLNDESLSLSEDFFPVLWSGGATFECYELRAVSEGRSQHLTSPFPTVGQSIWIAGVGSGILLGGGEPRICVRVAAEDVVAGTKGFGIFRCKRDRIL